MSNGSKVMVALDNMTATEAIKLAARLRKEGVAGFKANDLLDGDRSAQELCEILSTGGREFFADIKVKEVPSSAANRVRKHAVNGASMITVHASGGTDMMKAAVDAFESNKRKDARGIFAVTVLTSLNNEQCWRIYGADVRTTVLRLAGNAIKAGVKGIICSPTDLEYVRPLYLDQLEYIVAGVRPEGSDPAGQARPGTPTTAIKNGATLLVVGSPIYGASDKVSALRSINQEVAAAL